MSMAKKSCNRIFQNVFVVQRSAIKMTGNKD